MYILHIGQLLKKITPGLKPSCEGHIGAEGVRLRVAVPMDNGQKRSRITLLNGVKRCGCFDGCSEPMRIWCRSRTYRGWTSHSAWSFCGKRTKSCGVQERCLGGPHRAEPRAGITATRNWASGLMSVVPSRSALPLIILQGQKRFRNWIVKLGDSWRECRTLSRYFMQYSPYHVVTTGK